MSKSIPVGRVRVCVALASVALMMAVGCTTRPLADPSAIAAAETPAESREAILRTLIENRWTIVSDQPGEIVARYDRSNWTMVVGVDYANQVSVRYVGSENLDYGISNGTPVIHRGYNARARRLSDLIAIEIAAQQATDALPAVAAPSPADTLPE